MSIHFCGGCNPRIDRGEIARQVRDILKEKGYEVIYNGVTVDFVIYLSGCTANCALKYKSSHDPSMIVAAGTVDAVAVIEEKLVTEIVTKVRHYFEGLEKSLSK